jgi:hypothetical protein
MSFRPEYVTEMVAFVNPRELGGAACGAAD